MLKGMGLPRDQQRLQTGQILACWLLSSNVPWILCVCTVVPKHGNDVFKGKWPAGPVTFKICWHLSFVEWPQEEATFPSMLGNGCCPLHCSLCMWNLLCMYLLNTIECHKNSHGDPLVGFPLISTPSLPHLASSSKSLSEPVCIGDSSRFCDTGPSSAYHTTRARNRIIGPPSRFTLRDVDLKLCLHCRQSRQVKQNLLSLDQKWTIYVEPFP